MEFLGPPLVSLFAGGCEWDVVGGGPLDFVVWAIDSGVGVEDVPMVSREGGVLKERVDLVPVGAVPGSRECVL